ncbi:small, acid-soluble spore protein, alpha/beta type [Anaerosporobacter faecicola]|uniref:small, acid-soluble spore protein, alpha/beta type n=1 Tax=Anaerosporobacter faecicola TaxID=2718714 RepID=UPI00143A5A1D|nr:small, acid-soluble spore protein, alpha/beta type [Anaerosporobacter faecicola]
MTKKKEKPIDLNNIKPEEQLKYEVAEELGLLPKVLETGWKSLSAKESGRIGGIITRKKKQMKQEALLREGQNEESSLS